MKILGIDPGITTGYAVIDQSGHLLRSGNLKLEDLGDSILVTLSGDPDLEVVVEDIPIPTRSPMNRTLSEVVSWCRQTFPNAELVSPGQWKQVGPIINLRLPPKETDEEYSEHEKDAFRLATYFLVFMKNGHPR